ncbi:hypothetical protein L6164_013623 [Bauhinia variegata]|uniref:Uncharacterized protein n=1 Tax=Bauhinia variegata TaxID=167791 RepID=A0ACB9NFY6_BAUVA|nr:hypothetical protein L6164_013623 [Bauhinia variegata]
MAAEKLSSREIDTCSSRLVGGNQGISLEESPSTTNSNLAKEMARRALLRSHICQNRRRKSANNGVKSLPSRLSKVSLAEDQQNKV